MNEYKDEPKDSMWLYTLLIFIVLLPGFVGGYENDIKVTTEETK